MDNNTLEKKENVVLSPETLPREITRRANIVARKSGYGRATAIVAGKVNRVIERVDYGYRKYSTGEYVSNSYRKNFGWKNTYYQPAKTIVELDIKTPLTP